MSTNAPRQGPRCDDADLHDLALKAASANLEIEVAHAPSGVPLRAYLMLSLLVVTVLAGCSGSDSTTNPPGDQKTVAIKDFNFNPSTVNLVKGSTLVWTNEGAVKHTVTADGGSFDSGDILAGKTYTHQFDNAGTFAYKCKLHPNMAGSVKVE